MLHLFNSSLAALLITVSFPVHANEILVSAAASLNQSFKEIANNYMQENPGIKVDLTFGASDTLQRQIVNGAPVDIFASADAIAMEKANRAGLIQQDTIKNFVANTIVLIVPVANYLKIKDLDSLLSNQKIKYIAVGNPEIVPAGRYTRSSLKASGHWNEIKKKMLPAQNVRQVLDYVARNEVDAGFVFSSDASIAMDKVKVIDTIFSPEPVLYPIAMVQRKGTSKQAKGFYNYVLSEKGMAVLLKYGFKKPL